MLTLITGDAVEVPFGLKLPYRAADHAYCHNYPDVNRDRELRHPQCWSSNQSNTLRHIRDMDEAGLCGTSLPTGPTALPSLGRSRPEL